MNSVNTFRLLLGFLLIGAAVFVALQIWRRKRNNRSRNTGVDFRPSIGFTRLDGWASLALLLRNESNRQVWSEEIEIVLTDLIANDQTCEASRHEIQKIHQAVQPHDMLPISLVETIYKAAGKPQRKYSCLMSAIVRYRVGEEWLEKPMPPYRLNMAGLTVVNNRRVPWTKSEFKPQDKSRDRQMMGMKSK